MKRVTFKITNITHLFNRLNLYISYSQEKRIGHRYVLYIYISALCRTCSARPKQGLLFAIITFYRLWYKIFTLFHLYFIKNIRAFGQRERIFDVSLIVFFSTFLNFLVARIVRYGVLNTWCAQISNIVYSKSYFSLCVT